MFSHGLSPSARCPPFIHSHHGFWNLPAAALSAFIFARPMKLPCRGAGPQPPAHARICVTHTMSEYSQLECQNLRQLNCQFKGQKIRKINCRDRCHKKCQNVCWLECQKVCEVKCQNVCRIECPNLCQLKCQFECQKICKIKCHDMCMHYEMSEYASNQM